MQNRSCSVEAWALALSLQEETPINDLANVLELILRKIL